MATPHVAGGVGLIYSVVGGTSSSEVIDIILSTTRPLSSLSGNCATGGVLNVAEALENTFLGPQITMLSEMPFKSLCCHKKTPPTCLVPTWFQYSAVTNALTKMIHVVSFYSLICLMEKDGFC